MICLIWAFFRLPETKGFSFSVLFANRVPARKFKWAVVDERIHTTVARQSTEKVDEKALEHEIPVARLDV